MPQSAGSLCRLIPAAAPVATPQAILTNRTTNTENARK